VISAALTDAARAVLLLIAEALLWLGMAAGAMGAIGLALI
jgi:hypothetical protein